MSELAGYLDHDRQTGGFAWPARGFAWPARGLARRPGALARLKLATRQADPLDGSRLLDVSSDKLWLVFGGRRHHVASIGVHQSLFRQSVPVERVDFEVVARLEEGPELLFGTRLVRAETQTTIHLLTVFPTKVVRHKIPSTAVFDKYGFDYALCQTLPTSLLAKMSQGRPLK